MNGIIAAIAAFINGLIFIVGVIIAVILGSAVGNMLGPYIGFAAFFFSFLFTVVACSFIAYLSSMRSELVAIRSLLSGHGFDNSANDFLEEDDDIIDIENKFEPPALAKNASKRPEWKELLSRDVYAARQFIRVSKWGEAYGDLFAYRYMSGNEDARDLANEISKLLGK